MSRKSSLSVPSPAKGGHNCIGSDDGWTDETTKELLNKMKQVIPKPDVAKYKTQLEKFVWAKVKIGNFSDDECKKQWERICKKLRKYKTLSDLVADSIEYIENPYKGNIKKHPDHPKRPLTPYFRFFLREREKYAAAHKEMSNLEITNILSKEYREISIDEKEKYMNEWKQEMVEYRSKLEQFKKDHSEYYEKSPPRPSRTPLQIFNQENASIIPSRNKKKLSKKELDEKLKRKYHDLHDDQKLPYILRAIEEQEKYKEELDMYKKSHPDFVPTAAQTKSTLTISDWRIHDKSLGRPDRPPANGYNLFCTRMMLSEEMKHLTSRERIMECGQKWKFLTDGEKSAYQNEFVCMRDQYKTDMKNFLKSLPPRQKEEYLERKKENEAKKSSKRKVSLQVKEEPLGDVDSSSEEEEAGDDESGSDSSSSDSSSSGEEENDEDEQAAAEPAQPAAKITSPAPLRPTTPISALFLYQKAHRAKLAAKYPKASKSDITLMLARRFNNLPLDKKAKYLRKEKEQRAIYNEQMRKHLLSEQEQAKNNASLELKPITGEQIFQERNKTVFLKKASGDHDQAQALLRKAWTNMTKEKKKKFISVAHERNAKNIAEHQVAKAAAEENKKKKNSGPLPVERHLSQKEIKSYLELEPKKVPKDALQLFKMEQKPRLTHLIASARNQELNRLWNGLSPDDKNAFKRRAKAGVDEYNKKLQRWIKSLPPQAHEAYQATLSKKANGSKKSVADNAKVVANTSKKRKLETTKTSKNSKKAKIAQEDSEESSDDSSDDGSSSSSDSDDDTSSSSDDDSSSDGSDSSDDESNGKTKQGKNDDSSGDSSSSSSDDDDSDSD